MFNTFKPTVKKPTPLTSSLFSPTTTVAKKSSTPVSIFGSNVMNGNGASAIQSIFKPSLSSNQSQQSNVSKPIQASGVGNQYASNQNNYKPITSVQGGQQYQNPLVVPNKPAAPAPSASQNYMSSVNQGAANQTALAEKMRADAQNFKTQQNTLANQQLNASGQDYQNTFNQFKGDTEASIAANAAAGETQKSNARDNFGEAQKLAAQTRRETQGQTQRTFANLNTLDSRGEGSFGQATENQDSAFNSFTQGNLKQQAQKLTEIDAQIQQAERTARAAITTEQQKMTGLLRDIEYAKQNNDLQLASQLTEDYNKTQSYIYDIADNVQQMKYSFSLEQEKLNAAQEAISQQTANLSPEFIQTGVAKTMNDFIFRTQHPEMFAKVGAATGGKKTEKQMAYEAAGTIAGNALQKLDAGGVETGIGQGTLGSIGETFGTNSDSQQAYRADIAAMRTAIQNALLGANMSPREMEQILAAIPQYSDDPSIARQKLKSLQTNASILAGSGQQVSQAGDSLSQDQISQILASLGN